MRDIFDTVHRNGNGIVVEAARLISSGQEAGSESSWWMGKPPLKQRWSTARQHGVRRCPNRVVSILLVLCMASLLLLSRTDTMIHPIRHRRKVQEMPLLVDLLQSPLVMNRSMSGATLGIESCGENASTSAPWLLPPRASCLPYYDLTDLIKLAEHRSLPKGRFDKAISVIFFSANMAEVTQNAIYSMVRFGGVDNYIVACWNDFDLATCQDLNLPCADAAKYLPRKLENAPSLSEEKLEMVVQQDKSTEYRQSQQKPPPNAWGAGFGTADYKTIVWGKPAVVLALMDRGFAVHSSDVDLSYGPKDVWESYLAYIDAAGTDGAIHLEMGKSPINTGNFVMLPTEGGKSFMRSWIAQTNHHIDAGGNQTPLKDLQSEEAYYLCELLDECGTKRKGINSSRRKAALLRTFRPPWWKAGSNDVCRLSGDPPPPKVDPCHPMLMYVHPVCTKNRAGKLDVIKQMGFWFMVEDERYTNRTYAGCPIDATVATMVPRCTPREDAGRGFETCQTRLAFSGQLW